MRYSWQLVAILGLVFMPLACNGTDEIIIPQGIGLQIDESNAAEAGSMVIGAAEFMSDLGDLMLSFEEIFGGGSGTYPCPGGGTIVAQITDVAPVGDPSPGDNGTFTFNGCVAPFGEDMVSLQGTFSFTVPTTTTQAQLAQTGFALAFDLVFNDMKIVWTDEILTLNGTVRYATTSTDGIVYNSSWTGKFLDVYIQETPGDSYVIQLSNFNFNEMWNDSNNAYALGFMGDMSDSRGGSIFFESTTVLAGTEPDYPGSGVWYIEGMNNSRCTYFVVDTTQVRLQVDKDGDGTVDADFTLPWDSVS